MKYVIFDSDGIETPIIFPDWLTHKQIVLQIKEPVISAGKIDLTDSEFSNTKGSASLKLSGDLTTGSRDKELLKKVFNFCAYLT